MSYSDNGKLLVCSRSIVTMVKSWVCSRSMLSYSDNGKLFGLLKCVLYRQ